MAYKYHETKRKYHATKRGHLTRFLAKARERAKLNNVPIDIDLAYLESIATDKCPIFNHDFVWGQGNGKHPYRASLDRIIPELGYIKGNVVFISLKANTVKNDVTEKELYAIADWLHDERKRVLNAVEGKPTPVPTQHPRTGKKESPHGVVHGAGPREDCDGSHHHRGESEGQDACDSTKESCRICMGSGVRQMEALKLYESCESYGLSEGEVDSLAKLFGCICHQS